MDIDNTTEHKRHSLPIAVKMSAASTAGEFSGWASTFGPPSDSYGDQVAFGAFKATIELHRARGTSPALAQNHDMAQIVGVITQLTETPYGLKCDGKLALDIQRGADCHALMKMGALGLSIGYRPTSATPMGRNGRMLNSVDLFEVSCCAIPANHNSKIISVKAQPNLVDLHNRKVAERILRDGGYSHSQSKHIVSLATTFFKSRDAACADQALARQLMKAQRAIHNTFFN